ncbi:MAG TPA: DUF2339 domain-containing protein [Novosphingobium sp.]|nr:DUF2339 domain-containing protein [Novosphingobium sp.]
MILWAAIVGALIGLSTGEVFGLVFGGIVGAGMGVWLRTIMESEVRREVERQIASREPAQPAAASAEPHFEPPAAAPAAAAPAAPPKRTEPEPKPQAAAPKRPEPALAQSWPEQAVRSEPVVHSGGSDFQPATELADRIRDWFLGGNTIVRVGLVILFVGLVFLARLVAQAGLFPIEARLATIALAGAGLLGFGFSRRIKKPDFALHLQGAGVAVMYLTVFAAAKVYDVLPPAAAFGFMVVIAALGAALAVMQNSLVMALASFLGGFAVPVLLGGKAETPTGLFTYMTVLNLAILGIAWKKSWRALNLLGFFATFALASLWGFSSYEDRHLMICQLFLAISVAIYLATAVLYAHNTKGPFGNVADSTLLFGTALTGFGIETALVRHIPYGSAFAALGFGALYLAVTAIAMRRAKAEMRLVNESMLAIGVGFVTLAVPLALDARWTSGAWALEGLGAFWVGARQARWMPRAFGLLLQMIAGAVALGTLDTNVSAIPLGNNGFITPLLVALPMVLTAWLLRKELPHSGSSWAKGWVRAEPGFEKPWYMGGFLFAVIAVVQEASRRLPALGSDDYPRAVLSDHGQLFAIVLALLGLMALSDWFGRKRQWEAASLPGLLSLPLLWFAFPGSVAMGRYVLFLPDLAVWAAALALHLWLLRRRDADDAHAGHLLRGANHAGTVWLGTAMLANVLWLGVDRGNLWDTSWAGVVFLISATAVLALLTRWAGSAAPRKDLAGLGWPLDPHARVYWWGAALPLALLTFGGAFLTALIAEGITDPLPYVPLVNPVDLAIGLALVALALWRRMLGSAAKIPSGAEPIAGGLGRALGGILAFVWINTIWLRTAHHFLGVGWSQFELAQSPTVQTGLTILWTLIATALMLFAHRRAIRLAWLTGAVLLGVVVAKLLLIDMAQAEGWARIVAFIGVGVMMLAIGYFVPLPPRKEDKA